MDCLKMVSHQNSQLQYTACLSYLPDTDKQRHTHTDMCMHARTHAHACMMCAHAHTHTHTHMFTEKRDHKDSRISTYCSSKALSDT